METCNFTLVIPSLDPDEKLTATVLSAIEAGVDDILLVDGIISQGPCFAAVLPDGRPAIYRDGRERTAEEESEQPVFMRELLHTI